MSAIPLARGDMRRGAADLPDIALRNRFAEANPVLTDQPVSLIARPALKKFATAGSGPIRGRFDEPGVFDGDMFVVSYDELYRVRATDGVPVFIGTIGGGTADVSFAATAPVGAEPAHLFFAEGDVLWLYMETAQATGTLTASGAIANSEVVRIGDVYYSFTDGDVDTGAPAGTVGAPWLVNRSGTAATDLATLYLAVNATGTPGTDYSTDLVRQPVVAATGLTTTTLTVTANAQGPTGNAIDTTETGTNLAWGAALMSGGGAAPLSQVAMPSSVGAISVAHINSYVTVVPVQAEAAVTIGRFYWIEPGAIVVDTLDFATAERAPDSLNQVVVSGDLFWLCGQKTVEPWQTTGNTAAPMLRYQGVIYDRGSWEGSAIRIKNSLVFTDQDGGVFQDGQRISTPDIEERIRRAIQLQASLTP